jgi:3-deoxy-7-phosphoheptulonate synthase
MGGDCSEDLNNFKTENITKTLETILESEKILLAKHSDLKVIKTARMCGQYAKPRSSLTETINGVTLPSFQGEIVNGVGFDEETRKPNPDFMLKAYNASLNARNLIIKTNTRYFYLAHEAMLLPYEEPLIRLKNGEYYLSSANLP